jgi:hypothetical protein
MAGEKQFGRKASIQVGTLLVTDLRLAGKIEKSLTPDPNKAEVQIYNLSADSRAKMTAEKDPPIIVEAGYESNIAQIFSGTVSKVSHVRNGADWVTKIICGDGEAQYRTARISESFGPGTKPADVVRKLVEATKLKAGNALTEVGKGGFAGGLADLHKGKVLSGNAAKHLESFLDSLGLTYSIQDGALQVLRKGQASSAEAVVLNAGTGLIGSPEYGETGKEKKTVLKVKCLLQPAIVPGRRIKLESETKTALARTDKVTHTFDSFAQAWYSDLECTLL